MTGLVLPKILNLPWTIAGLLATLLSMPKSFSLHQLPFAIVMDVRSFWWYTWLPGQKGVRAITIGNIILLGSKLEKRDLEHELVHIEQFEREPLILPFLALIESIRYGNRYSKYENEAYTRARNVWKGETKADTASKRYMQRDNPS